MMRCCEWWGYCGYDAALGLFIVVPVIVVVVFLPVNNNLAMKKIIIKNTWGSRHVPSRAPSGPLLSPSALSLSSTSCQWYVSLVAAHVILIGPFVFIGCRVVVVRVKACILSPYLSSWYVTSPPSRPPVSPVSLCGTSVLKCHVHHLISHRVISRPVIRKK